MAINLLRNSRTPTLGMDIAGDNVAPPVRLPGITSAGMNQAIQPMTNLQPAAVEMAPSNNALAEIMRPRRATNIERNPTTPLESTVKAKPKWYEVVGRIGDTLALMGGRDPLYSAFTGMDRAAEAEAMQKQAVQNFTQQPDNEDAFRALLQFMPPKDAMELRKSLMQTGPEPVKLGATDRLFQPDGKGGFTEVIGPDRAPPSVSPSAQIQLEQRIRAMLGDDEANEFLRSQIGPKGMSEYQSATLALAMERLMLDREKFANRPPSAAELKQEMKRVEAQEQAGEVVQQMGGFITEMKQAGEDLYRAGGMAGPGSTPADGLVAAALENVPLLERVTNRQSFQARETMNTLVNQTLPNLVSFMGGLTVGGKNLDSQGELKHWQNTFTAARDKGAFDAAMRRFETRMEQFRRKAFREANTPAAPAAAPRPAASPQRSPNAPRRREGAPTVVRRVNGRLVFE
jgi:hypothetical protein